MVIVYENDWYPGVVMEVTDTGTVVDCMKNVSIGKNCFRWPTPKDIMTYSDDEILCKISPPIPISRRGDYTLVTIDFDEANKLTKKWMKTWKQIHYHIGIIIFAGLLCAGFIFGILGKFAKISPV